MQYNKDRGGCYSSSSYIGQRVTWIHEMLWGLLQPGLQSTLNDLFGLYDDTIPLSHLDRIAPNIITLVASHIVVGVLLSPLEIIRTRYGTCIHHPLCLILILTDIIDWLYNQRPLFVANIKVSSMHLPPCAVKKVESAASIYPTTT